MKALKSASGRLALLLPAIALFVTGCAFTTGHVNLAYQSSGTAQKIATADSPHVVVQVSDRRATKIVGEKINGWGMKTADVVADNDVPDVIRNAIVTELNNRGFSQGTGGNTVSVALDNVQNQFTAGFFSGDATANVQMQVTVKKADGSVAYDRMINGHAKDWVELAREGNAETTLNAAIADAITNLFNDTAFLDALKKA